MYVYIYISEERSRFKTDNIRVSRKYCDYNKFDV